MRIRSCQKCPRWKGGWCSAYAKIMVATAPSCALGRKLMHREYMKLYMRNYTKKTKGESRCG